MGEIEKRQRVSLLGFAVQHAKALTHLKESEPLVLRVDDGPAKLVVARIVQHENKFELRQPRYLLADRGTRASAEAKGAFLGTMYAECQQQTQACFYLVGKMPNQGQLDDVLLVVTNQYVRPRSRGEEDPWDGAG